MSADLVQQFIDVSQAIAIGHPSAIQEIARFGSLENPVQFFYAVYERLPTLSRQQATTVLVQTCSILRGAVLSRWSQVAADGVRLVSTLLDAAVVSNVDGPAPAPVAAATLCLAAETLARMAPSLAPEVLDSFIQRALAALTQPQSVSVSVWVVAATFFTELVGACMPGIIDAYIHPLFVTAASALTNHSVYTLGAVKLLNEITKYDFLTESAAKHQRARLSLANKTGITLVNDVRRSDAAIFRPPVNSGADWNSVITPDLITRVVTLYGQVRHADPEIAGQLRDLIVTLARSAHPAARARPRADVACLAWVKMLLQASQMMLEASGISEVSAECDDLQYTELDCACRLLVEVSGNNIVLNDHEILSTLCNLTERCLSASMSPAAAAAAADLDAATTALTVTSLLLGHINTNDDYECFRDAVSSFAQRLYQTWLAGRMALAPLHPGQALEIIAKGEQDADHVLGQLIVLLGQLGRAHLISAIIFTAEHLRRASYAAHSDAACAQLAWGFIVASALLLEQSDFQGVLDVPREIVVQWFSTSPGPSPGPCYGTEVTAESLSPATPPASGSVGALAMELAGMLVQVLGQLAQVPLTPALATCLSIGVQMTAKVGAVYGRFFTNEQQSLTGPVVDAVNSMFSQTAVVSFTILEHMHACPEAGPVAASLIEALVASMPICKHIYENVPMFSVAVSQFARTDGIFRGMPVKWRSTLATHVAVIAASIDTSFLAPAIQEALASPETAVVGLHAMRGLSEAADERAKLWPVLATCFPAIFSLLSGMIETYLAGSSVDSPLLPVIALATGVLTHAYHRSSISMSSEQFYSITSNIQLIYTSLTTICTRIAAAPGPGAPAGSIMALLPAGAAEAVQRIERARYDLLVGAMQREFVLPSDFGETTSDRVAELVLPVLLSGLDVLALLPEMLNMPSVIRSFFAFVCQICETWDELFISGRITMQAAQQIGYVLDLAAGSHEDDIARESLMALMAVARFIFPYLPEYGLCRLRSLLERVYRREILNNVESYTYRVIHAFFKSNQNAEATAQFVAQVLTSCAGGGEAMHTQLLAGLTNLRGSSLVEFSNAFGILMKSIR